MKDLRKETENIKTTTKDVQDVLETKFNLALETLDMMLTGFETVVAFQLSDKDKDFNDMTDTFNMMCLALKVQSAKLRESYTQEEKVEQKETEEQETSFFEWLVNNLDKIKDMEHIYKGTETKH